MEDIALEWTVGTIVVSSGAFGLALAAGLRFFGLVTSAIKDRMEYRLKEKQQETADSGAVFRSALEYIDRQNADLIKLREELASQRTWFECELDSQKRKLEGELEAVRLRYESRLKEQDGQIASLKADLAKYREVLENGPVWAQKALREFGLK